MEDIKQKDSGDATWINELPIEEFPFDEEDFTDILSFPDPE